MQFLWVIHVIWNVLKESFTGHIFFDNQSTIDVATDDSSNREEGTVVELYISQIKVSFKRRLPCHGLLIKVSGLIFLPLPWFLMILWGSENLGMWERGYKSWTLPQKTQSLLLYKPGTVRRHNIKAKAQAISIRNKSRVTRKNLFMRHVFTT